MNALAITQSLPLDLTPHRIKPKSNQTKIISEQEYWEKYYENTEKQYEWNNGYLEEKPVSDYATTLIYNWFVQLLGHYLDTYHNATFTNLEMGFRLDLGQQKASIRKPDLGVIYKTNPRQLSLRSRTYTGTFDLCIEALSDSSKKEMERDTLIKKQEYARVGVQEYYILYDKKGDINQGVEFYQLKKGIYQQMERGKDDLIQSTVLPDFQFRVSDLYKRPSLKQMSLDSIYQAFVFPDYQLEKKRANNAEQRANEAEQEIIRLQKILAQQSIR